MTRKDYETIAAAIVRAQEQANNQPDFIIRSANLSGIWQAAETIADALAQDNQRFDRARFLTACGV